MRCSRDGVGVRGGERRGDVLLPASHEGVGGAGWRRVLGVRGRDAEVQVAAVGDAEEVLPSGQLVCAV